MGAWARAGWRVGDLGTGTIILQKLFNPERQITSKSFLLSSFLIGFSFSLTAEISSLELEFEENLPRKTASKRGLDRSQTEQPIKKNKFSYFARSCLRLCPQEIWERDYTKALFLVNKPETIAESWDALYRDITRRTLIFVSAQGLLPQRIIRPQANSQQPQRWEIFFVCLCFPQSLYVLLDRPTKRK